MTDSEDTTMASSETTGAPFKMVSRPNKSKRLKVTLEQKVPAERTHSCTIRVYFPPPRANSKFHPVTSMRNFLTELLKYEPSIVIVNTTTKAQLVLSTDQLPSKEEEFKKFFTITTDSRTTAAQQRVIIGCDLLSERTITEIKFDRQKPQFLDWMKKNKLFFESDSLGVNKTTTIGYLTRLHPQLTNRTNLKQLLNVALEDITIDPLLAIELDPALKEKHEEAESNGDTFSPAVPPFEVYKTRLTHGSDRKTYTHVIGVKCASSQAKLLKEFYSQLASPEIYEKQIGVFIPTGAIHLLGTEKYVNLIRENNAFLDDVTTIPVGDFQHPTLDIKFSTDSTTDIDQTTLQDVIAEQPWCLGVDRTNIANKVMITTTKTNIKQARDWLDQQLPLLYQQNIADKLDVTTLTHITPRRLDKPVLTAASTAYAKTLQQRVSTTTQQNSNKQFTKPSRTNKSQKVDISFDENDFPALKNSTTNNSTAATTTEITQTATNSTASSATSLTTTTPTVTVNQQPYDYKKELARISHDIETKLKKQFDDLFAQMEQKLEKLDKMLTQQAINNNAQDTKLDQFMQQQTTQKTEQDQFNETFTKRLDYLVVNMQHLLSIANPLQTTYPLPSSGNGQL